MHAMRTFAAASASLFDVAVVQETHRRIGFDREAMFARLNIRADLGTYQPVVL